MDIKPLPARPSLEQYKKQAKELIKLAKTGDSEALERVRKWHPQPDQFLALADAQWLIAREHGFDSWPKFARHIEELTRESSSVSKFEMAADAVVTGDMGTLQTLLRANPELARVRSTRLHRSTLLHYLGANGFEDYRQKSPWNAVDLAKILLDAGAEVDALADTYGKSTTLGLVASSGHPQQAGVQLALMEILLERGAEASGDTVVAALRNGRGEAAEFLAQRGAPLDLQGAAGVGRLDVVEGFFGEDGRLRANATMAQMQAGFAWACEYGRDSVVDFLLRKGVAVDTKDSASGLTGLHWAVVGGQLRTIQMLLDRGASLEVTNGYGGTALGQALWCAFNSAPGVDYFPVLQVLLSAGAKQEDGLLGWVLSQRSRSSLEKERIAEVLRAHGAVS